MRSFIALGLTAALAACGSSPATPDEALARDLELVGSSSASFELAPASSGTQVMSALEQGEKAPTATPAPSPERKPVARAQPQPRRQETPAPRPAPREVAQAPERAPEPVFEQPAPAPEPVQPRAAVESAPLGSGPAPAGGWKSMGEVIRDSRVPINP